jgi:hypothetical protein
MTLVQNLCGARADALMLARSQRKAILEAGKMLELIHFRLPSKMTQVGRKIATRKHIKGRFKLIMHVHQQNTISKLISSPSDTFEQVFFSCAVLYSFVRGTGQSLICTNTVSHVRPAQHYLSMPKLIGNIYS